MNITVKLIGPLVYSAGFSEKEICLPGHPTAEDALKFLNIDKTRPIITTRNGKAIAPSDPLSEGDRLAISPIYSGG